jgi:RHS repeat-associated protein
MKTKLYIIGLLLTLISSNTFLNASTFILQDDPKFNITGNWTISKTYVRTSGSTTYNQDITFYNGLGYPEQSINIAASPNNSKNIIKPIKYDNMMRGDAKTYLPYVSSNNTLAPDSSPFTLQQTFYTTLYGSPDAQYAYTENVYEPSVLNRVIYQYNTGNAFRTSGSEKRKQLDYYLNNSTDLVFKFDVSSTNNLTISYYGSGTLYKNSAINEDGTTLLTFIDKNGKKILDRTIAENGVKIDTYYVYNDLGQLVWAIQPEGSALLQTGSLLTSSVIADKYCFIYTYDGKGNVIEKRIPGKGIEYFVYDKGNRLVMSQDAKLRLTNDWLYYIYDNLNRLIEKNIVRGTLSRSTIQSYYNGSTFSNTYPGLGGTTDVRKPLPTSDFTFITTLESTRYKSNSYHAVASSQQYTLTLSGTYLLVHTDYIVNWGAYANDYYNFYVLSDDNINNLYYICTDQNDPTIKYYYIPVDYADIVENIVEQDPFMTYEYYYTFPGSGTPLTSMVITSDYSPDLRGPLTGTFTVPSFLAFEGVSNVATTTELDSLYTHNELVYEKKAILSAGSTNGVSGYVERAFYYDYLGRVIQTVEKNHLGGISRTSLKYDLAGNILTRHESHQRGPGLSADIKQTTYTIDERGRMRSETTSINGGTSATVSYTYNELGQLTGKTYGNGATESIAYNIQGWLSSKSSAKSGTNLFSMNLLYYNSTRATNKYTGNIAEWQWTQGTASQNSYALSYDKLDRLTNSNRYVGGSAENSYTEKNITYDKNGNITQLQRYGSNGSTLQDNFTYSYNGSTYNGNKLSSISGSVSATYAYDNNGNMTTDGRKNLQITYNVLNLQQSLSQNGTTVASYRWLADGTKCGVVDNNSSGYDYLGSLIYSRTGSTRTLESTDFGGGRIVYSGGTYNPYYYITDHLGSVRVITDNSGAVQERNDYYPFGGKHANSAYAQLPVNKYKFNGKELQTTGNTGFLDYGARMYDDVIGRWSVVDLMAENSKSLSPYTYGNDNPIRCIDPDGRVVITVNGAAQQAILNTLTKKDMEYVKFNDKGLIDRDLLNSANSTSGNFGALKQLVNDERTFEFNVTDKITYKDENGNLVDKSMGIITQGDNKNGSFGANTGEEGWMGVTQTPGNEANKYNSPDNTIKIVINSGLSEKGQAQITAHEAYGHAYLYSKGAEHRHQVKSTTEGFKETNKTLADQITRAIAETIKNMQDKKNDN